VRSTQPHAFFRCPPSSIPIFPPRSLMTFLDQIEPLKQAALAELAAAPDLAALEQARVGYLGSNGKFTAS